MLSFVSSVFLWLGICQQSWCQNSNLATGDNPGVYAQVKRCEEMLRKLRFFQDQIVKEDIFLSQKADVNKPYDLDELEVRT